MDYIAEQLRPLAVPIDSLHEDPANARKGHAVDRIAASLRQYGQRKPIVVNRAQGGKVEAGNGTLLAAKSLGWSHIAAVFVEDDAATAAAYGIADNRVGELSEWDVDALADLIPEVGDLFTGFDGGELNRLIDSTKSLQDPNALWQGMPEFKAEDVFGAMLTLKVHFASEQDIADFARLVNQNINPKSAFIWYPKQTAMNLKKYQVQDES